MIAIFDPLLCHHYFLRVRNCYVLHCCLLFKSGSCSDFSLVLDLEGLNVPDGIRILVDASVWFLS